MATVLIPWRGGCVHRAKAWDWVGQRWASTEHDIVVCEAPSGPWCKAAAVMPCVATADEVVVVADADCWSDGIPKAIAAAEAGAAWAVPHRRVHRLTEKATEYLLGGYKVPHSLEVEGDEVNGPGPYNGFVGGGIFVVRRDVLLDVPLDPRFLGWGGEDASWRDAMLTLIGEPHRERDPLFHLWHPPQPRRSRKVGSAANQALRTRYVRAVQYPRRMHTLVAEATAALSVI
jgi:hypothetical protein